MLSPTDDTASAYNMKAVVEATGVRAETLRSWERRFQILRPQRTDSGYRKYSHQDVQKIRWLQARLAEGFTIARAVELLRGAGDRAELLPEARTPPVLCREFIAACRNFDETAAERALAEALTFQPPEHLCLSIIAPALVALGDHGVAVPGEMAPAHFACVLVRARLLALYAWAGGGPPSAPLVLLAGAPGEQHDLGLLMVALFARRAGMRTIFLGAGADSAAIRLTSARRHPAIVCLSASAPDTAMAAVAVAASLKSESSERPPTVVIGGGGAAMARDATVGGFVLATGDAAHALPLLTSLAQR